MKVSYQINTRVEFVDESLPVADAVQLMNAKGISSILVKDSHGLVCGILTERDIVRKFTLLDMSDKLSRNVGIVATRQVAFADAEDLHESIVRLHFDKGLRHFPVLKGKEPRVENVVGMLTVTDILRHYLRRDAQIAVEQAAAKDHAMPLRFALLTFKPEIAQTYLATLRSKHLEAEQIRDLGQFVTSHPRGDMPLILDMDGWPMKKLGDLIVQAKKYKGQLILTTSDPNVVNLFRRYLDKGRQTIVSKPFDADFVVWLLTAFAAAAA